jgi:hypothetical protein
MTLGSVLLLRGHFTDASHRSLLAIKENRALKDANSRRNRIIIAFIDTDKDGIDIRTRVASPKNEIRKRKRCHTSDQQNIAYLD